MIRFILLLGLVLIGCSNVSQPLDIRADYQRDIIFKVNGKTIKGVGVVPFSISYDLQIDYNYGKINLLTFSTCHREIPLENQENRVGYLFFPSDIEKSDSCSLKISIYDLKGRDAWGLLLFERPDANLVAIIQCNGDMVKAKGVSVCQSKVGTVQKIIFATPVKMEALPGCKITQKVDNQFEYEVTKGFCYISFKSAQGEIHDHTIYGYDHFIIRE